MNSRCVWVYQQQFKMYFDRLNGRTKWLYIRSNHTHPHTHNMFEYMHICVHSFSSHCFPLFIYSERIINENVQTVYCILARIWVLFLFVFSSAFFVARVDGVTNNITVIIISEDIWIRINGVMCMCSAFFNQFRYYWAAWTIKWKCIPRTNLEHSLIHVPLNM